MNAVKFLKHLSLIRHSHSSASCSTSSYHKYRTRLYTSGRRAKVERSPVYIKRAATTGKTGGNAFAPNIFVRPTRIYHCKSVRMSLLHSSLLSAMARTRPVVVVAAAIRPFSSGDDKGTVHFQPVYVNHFSKLVLEHLQNYQPEWLVRRGLNRGLRINDDGTFVLRFPVNEFGREAGRIW